MGFEASSIKRKGARSFENKDMSSEEIYKQVQDAANEFISRYGEDAAQQAARRAEELLAVGEHEGHHLWCQIYHAITTLTGEAPNRFRH